MEVARRRQQAAGRDYAKHDLVAVDASCIGPETSGWFRKEVKSVEEMKGIKMRFFGLAPR